MSETPFYFSQTPFCKNKTPNYFTKTATYFAKKRRLFSLEKATFSAKKVDFFRAFSSKKIAFVSAWFSIRSFLHKKTPFFFESIKKSIFWEWKMSEKTRTKSAKKYEEKQQKIRAKNRTLLPLQGDSCRRTFTRSDAFALTLSECFWAFSPRVAWFATKIAFFQPESRAKVCLGEISSWLFGLVLQN